MKRKVLDIVSILFISTHFIILYLWVFQWNLLATQTGLISWIASIVIALAIIVVYHNLRHTSSILLRRLITATTLLTVMLGISSFVIGLITSSMP